MLAGFLFTILIMVTLTGFATSNELKYQDETETETDENFTTTCIECKLNSAFRPPIYCWFTYNMAITSYKQEARYRKIAESQENIILYEIYTMIADAFQKEGDFFWRLYEIACI